MAQAEVVGAKSGGYKTIVYVICSVAALGGLLFGLDQGFIANSLATIQQHYTSASRAGRATRPSWRPAASSALCSRGSSRASSGASGAWSSPASSSRRLPRYSALLPPLAGALRLPLRSRLRGRRRILHRPALSVRDRSRLHSRIDGYALPADDHDRNIPDLADQRFHCPNLRQSRHFSAAHVPDHHVVRGTHVRWRLHPPREPALADA